MKNSTLFSLALFFTISVNSQAQEFTRVTDSANALARHGVNTGNIYTGASWIDYDGDGWLDCFVNSNYLYHNNQDGSFTRVDFGPAAQGLGQGNSWGDIDNDGDPDVIIAASPSRYFRNDNGAFTEAPLLENAPANMRFWSACLGDYNEDGWLDVYLTHPRGFLGASRTSLLLANNGNGAFSEVAENTETDDELAAFTVGSWWDYDLDGDLDLFVGSGEVSFLSRDHIYINQYTETGTPSLERLTTGPLAEDLRDGQNWNWIDYDNDGDLDGYVTNYLSSRQNDLYRNDGGQYVRMTAEDAGPIAGQAGLGLTNLWADFDNDGFLDCYVAFDGGKARFYHNNGDGAFSEEEKVFTQTGATRGATAGDYDNDGFVDLFVSSQSATTAGLFHNEGNGNQFFNLELRGTASNTSAIGARVRLKATINGRAMWQQREINAQNSFNGHNSLRAHFGLGDAAAIDSLLIEWPMGMTETYTHLAVGQFCRATEGEGTSCSLINATWENGLPSGSLELLPNLSQGGTVLLRYQLPGAGMGQLDIFGLNGRRLPGLTWKVQGQGSLPASVEGLANGVYVVRLRGEGGLIAKKLVVQR